MKAQQSLTQAYVQDLNLKYTPSQLALCLLYRSSPAVVAEYASDRGLLELVKGFKMGNVEKSAFKKEVVWTDLGDLD